LGADTQASSQEIGPERSPSYALGAAWNGACLISLATVASANQAGVVLVSCSAAARSAAVTARTIRPVSRRICRFSASSASRLRDATAW